MNARTQRLIRESSVSENALRTSALIALVLVLVAVAMLPANAPQVIAGSPIDARATSGNVVDLTY